MRHSHALDKKKCADLWQAVLSLKTKQECWNFFRDLCTLEEITAMADRWQAVKMINQNKPYRQIAKKIKMSSTTVARVAHWLNNGQGGYRLMLKRLNK
ncbi:MAG: hypothetical protein A2927_00420 [Candidatus Komeilibacteria bacterium RIFCSPLOWO2_01_FULL_45_10]|uniref:TrpR, YerC/YecD n=1 Tax=Candidatus Komeilibacteria bacterium RIFCSPLOWO2_01_FULL_45_10 TaxID=1798550 RepID=A0A1G2BJE4_9BACT|nr:MAG: hypothetical protein A2927_00420 [Candidatus Komeilibacteria bacterium RIFCSPLOWO2_01_FULL_45_10]